MTELLVIDMRVKDGRGHVVLADPAGDPLAGRHIEIDFPLGDAPCGSYPEQEEQLATRAEAVLREAASALSER